MVCCKLHTVMIGTGVENDRTKVYRAPVQTLGRVPGHGNVFLGHKLHSQENIIKEIEEKTNSSKQKIAQNVYHNTNHGI